jgi:hydroxymethylpyrimidine pyrophosphatase-like HAD family hydrolase
MNLPAHLTILATDYDGTLAEQGHVAAPTIAALDRWRAAGRRSVLVTGRHLPDLFRVFPEINRFDMIVAENGSLLHDVGQATTHLLGTAPPAALVETLRARGVEPLYVGQGNTATLKPHEQTVRATLAELGLEWHVILNKNDVIIMPPGIDKAAGLRAALDQLGADPAQAVGVGDAENDEHLFDVCAYNVAVANALPALKARADYVTRGESSAGVAELLDALLAAATPPDAG